MKKCVIVYLSNISASRNVEGTSQGSSVSLVSDYGLDNPAIEVRSLAVARGFFLLTSVTDCGAHPASCPMDTGGLFPEVKLGQGVTLATHPHLVLRP
jgi:hypothetical protein